MAAADSTTDEFRKHVQKFIKDYCCYGYTSIEGANTGRKTEFVPLDALKNFWTVGKIREVLWSVHPRIQTDPQHLLNKYLVVFSVLVWMSAPEKIDTIKELNVDDHNLPVDDRLINGTDQSDTKDFLNEFSKNQWRFCPLTLDCRPFKKQLNPYHILPITSQELLDPIADEEDDDVLVYKAQWHRSCLGSLPPSYVVLKEYRVTGPTSDSYKMLSNEVDIYSNLADENFSHIVKYYGSVVQQGKFTLILEYASGGNLVSYFQKTPHPHTTAGRASFWQSFSSLLLGLDKIHHLSQAKDFVLKGAHQDIRPQNILVFPASAETQHCVRFKLADFGTGHVRKCRVRGLDALAAQRVGNGMYSSPESYRDDKVTKPQSPACDIWSLGAVASEALVWSIQGEAKRCEYQENRCKMTGETNLKGGFHEGSFHDGKCRLPIVEEQHQAVLQFVDDDDTVSTEASEIILGRMLIANPLDSFPALDIFAEWTVKQDGDQSTNSHHYGRTNSHHYGAQERPHSSLPKAPAKRNTKLSVQTRSTRKRDSINSAYSHHTSWSQHHDEDVLSEEPSNISPPALSRADTAAQRRSPYHGYTGGRAGQAQRGNGSPGPSTRRVSKVGSCIKAKSKIPSWLKGSNLFTTFPSLRTHLAELRGYGNGRDQFFIVDDSQSMTKHRDQLSRTVRVLIYLLKIGAVDPDKMELYYTCSRDKHVGSKSSGFEKHVDEHAFSNDTCHIFERFDEIMEEVLKTNNRASIYILTNARWDAAPKTARDLCRVDDVIKRILEAIKDKHKLSNHVGVQFIRFYDSRDDEDAFGGARLRLSVRCRPKRCVGGYPLVKFGCYLRNAYIPFAIYKTFGYGGLIFCPAKSGNNVIVRPVEREDKFDFQRDALAGLPKDASLLRMISRLQHGAREGQDAMGKV
ncbi:hypothetical protein B0T25DRAFT_521295 [Lasiosphaeria hispida]|uniref:Protein kinase domain-containing protein n=1 Tax=Lasiosphaeria hispida TaxID=260671 RepID=A0AAJ0HCC8_9PEZI|nr:hypothetical protein B0T25DRAFT_521295 [Lasiosphaeria hispida]